MAEHAYEVKHENEGLQLIRRDDNRWTVVTYRDGRYESVMPGDAPKGGGSAWFGPLEYVTQWWAESTARREYRRITTGYYERV